MSKDEEFKALMAMHEAGPHAKRKRPAYKEDGSVDSYVSVADANAQRVKSGQEILASMRVEPNAQAMINRHTSNFVGVMALNYPPDEPVPDSPSEIAPPVQPAVSAENMAWLSEQLDAERARAKAATRELREETELRVFWRDRCLAAEKELAVIIEQRRQARGQYELMCEEAVRQAAEREAREADRAQIVRLMAERDEARNLLAVANDKLTPFLAAEPKPEPELKHNPFRVIEKDRRMMGGPWDEFRKKVGHD